MRRMIGITGAALLALSSPAGAATAAKMTIDQLKTMVSGLGYDATGDGKTYVGITDQGKSKQNVFFGFTDDSDAIVNIYMPFADIEGGKEAALPAQPLLEASAAGPYTYAISTGTNDKKRVVLQGFFDAASLTKQSLRRDIDGLVAAADAGESLWDQDSWKAPAAAVPAATAPAAPPQSLDAARAAYEALSEKSPLTAQNAMFVSKPVTLYGDYAKRPDNAFKHNETINIYMEPKGYVWKPVDGNAFNINLVGDFALLKDGTVLFEKKAMISQSATSHDRIQDLYYNLDFSTEGMPAGDYTIRYTLHDNNGGKTAEVLLPLKSLP